MTTVTQRLHSGWQGLLERIERARVRSELLERNDRVLADMGFSRERLEQGANAWPWRQEAACYRVFEMPDVTPGMIRHYVQEGRRLRAEEMRGLSRKVFDAVARAGRALVDRVSDRLIRSPDKRNPC